MSDSNVYNLSSAQLDDGTIDFYTLLDQSASATPDELRAKIQALYSDAQANRDHRNLNKRREYQTLLELLPTARTVLLDDSKRARYDAFLNSAKSGSSPGDFEAFINELIGASEAGESRTDVLGVQDKPKEVRARVITTQPSPPTNPRAGSSPIPRAPTPPRPTSGGVPARPAPSSSGGSAALLGAIGAFVVGAIIGWFAFKIVGAIGLGILFAAIAFVLLNKPKRRVGL